MPTQPTPPTSVASRRQRPRATAIAPLHHYHNVHLVLRQRILDGRYPRGSLLAGERDLAAEFGVARVTVRSALAALQRDGLIRREQGRGTIVTEPAPAPSRSDAVDAFDVLFDSILSLGLRSRARVLEFGPVAAVPAVAAALQLDDGAPVLRIVRQRTLDQRPISYTMAWLPTALGRGLGRRELTARPLLSWLKSQGVRVERADETLSACAAEPAVAAELDVPLGAPLLEARRTLFDAAGRPVMHFVGRYRPERYQYRLQLSREPRAARVEVISERG
ncbi:MAG: GntR family transcriptional regulator [Rhodoplanes sp.]|uniref:GntR family transcriptional regulator n=1 Tax=Rhodoplanes sp. TaxID=1968906 RepID=UPI0018200D15|nr:GntR family transcriptional regulator [Rhodoplanes sp.]NVO15033.1 GntR family transcriptional regulator [Rhodoplanes sp.]